MSREKIPTEIKNDEDRNLRRNPEIRGKEEDEEEEERTQKDSFSNLAFLKFIY